MGPVRLPSVLPRDGPALPGLPAVPPGAGRPVARPYDTTGAPPPSARASPFARLLRGLATEIDGGEATVRHVVTLASVSEEGPRPLELLALQASVYRYGEALDLAARLVDRAATSVKTVLQGQQ